MYLLFSFVAAAVSAAKLFTGSATAQLGETCTVERQKPLDLFFVVDGSASIGRMDLDPNGPWGHVVDPTAFAGQLKFMKTLIESTMTVEGDRVGIWQFAADHESENMVPGRLEFALGTPIDEVLQFVMTIKHLMGITTTKEAIDKAVEQFNSVPYNSDERDRLLVIITDGEPTCLETEEYTGCHDPCHDMNGSPITEYINLLDANDVRTVIIGVNDDAEKLHCLVDDSEENIVKITDFRSFQEYRDPTGDDQLLCVNPEELKLECCRASVFTDQLKTMYDNLCRGYVRTECIHRRGTVLGSCEWGVDTEGKLIDGCGVTTASPTSLPTSEPTAAPTPAPTMAPTKEPTFKPTAAPTPAPTLVPTNKPTSKPTEQPTAEPTEQPTNAPSEKPTNAPSDNPTPSPTPTSAPTKMNCEPLDNCVVKGGEKVIGWVGVGGRIKASDACACAERCAMEGGTESKWHRIRKICKCWKQSTHIEMKYEPFDANRKHGGNAGGKTQCVKLGNSVAEITHEEEDSTSVPTIPAPPTAAVTAEPTQSAEEYAADCEAKKQEFLNSAMADSGFCHWDDERCLVACA